jgi:hypothetical protein
MRQMTGSSHTLPSAAWSSRPLSSRRHSIAEGLRLDEIETPLDQAHIPGEPVDARRQTGVLRFEKSHSLFQFNKIGFDLSEIAADRAEQLQHQVRLIVAHLVKPPA